MVVADVVLIVLPRTLTSGLALGILRSGSIETHIGVVDDVGDVQISFRAAGCLSFSAVGLGQQVIIAGDGQDVYSVLGDMERIDIIRGGLALLLGLGCAGRKDR